MNAIEVHSRHPKSLISPTAVLVDVRITRNFIMYVVLLNNINFNISWLVLVVAFFSGRGRGGSISSVVVQVLLILYFVYLPGFFFSSYIFCSTFVARTFG